MVPVTVLTVLPLLLALLAPPVLLGCQDNDPPALGPSAAASTASMTVASATAAAEPPTEAAEACGCKGDHEPTSPTADRVEQRADQDGRPVGHAGMEFSGEAQETTVTELVQRPETWLGKTVRLQGHVSDMCHQRRWFALAGENQGAGPLRVLTVPVFLVPAGSVGKQVRVEGRVEAVSVDARAAEHMAKSHKLPMPSATGPSVQQVVLRATVAEFLDAPQRAR